MCIRDSINVTQNSMENYGSTSNVAVARVGDSFDKTVDNLAASAVYAEYGEEIRSVMDRKKVLADYAMGNAVSYTHLAG